MDGKAHRFEWVSEWMIQFHTKSESNVNETVNQPATQAFELLKNKLKWNEVLLLNMVLKLSRTCNQPSTNHIDSHSSALSYRSHNETYFMLFAIHFKPFVILWIDLENSFLIRPPLLDVLLLSYSWESSSIVRLRFATLRPFHWVNVSFRGLRLWLCVCLCSEEIFYLNFNQIYTKCNDTC